MDASESAFLLQLKDLIDERLLIIRKEEEKAEKQKLFSLVYSANNPYVEEVHKLKQEVAELKEIIKKGDIEREKEKETKTVGIDLTKIKEQKTMFTIKDCSGRFKNGYYEYRFRKLGLSVSKSSKSKAQAKVKMQQFLNALNQDLFGITAELPSNKKPEPNMFVDIADYFMYAIKQENVRPVTFRAYNSVYKNYVRKWYEHSALAEITPIRLQTDLKRLRDKSSRTFEDARLILSQIFDYAKANGLMTLNPVDAVYLPPHERTPGEAITKQEEKFFISQIRGTTYEFQFLVMLYAGARPSEAENTEIDWEREVIIIKNSKLKRHQKVKYRELPLFPMLKKFGYIEKKDNCGVNYLNDVFQTFLPNHSQKDLRHTFASRAKECGCNSEVVNAWQGHVPGQDMTARVYTHFSMEYQKEQAKILLYEV